MNRVVRDGVAEKSPRTDAAVTIMKFAVFNGDGVGSRPQRHLEQLIRMTGRIEALVTGGRLVAGCSAARQLTAIERGVIATRLLRDGIRRRAGDARPGVRIGQGCVTRGVWPDTVLISTR